MKKNRKPAARLGLMLLLAQALQGYTLVDEQFKPTSNTIAAGQFFAPATQLSAQRIDTDPQKLAAVARETLAFIARHRNDDKAVKAGLFQDFKISLEDVEKTLQTMIATIDEDTQAGRAQRMLDPVYLQQHFRLLRWSADSAGAKTHNVALPDQRLRITKYVVFEAKGSTVKTPVYNCALYALPADEANLSPEQAEARKATLLRYKFNKQQVVAGALDGKAVKPLVWLTRQGLEDALLQGSLMVAMPDGQRRMFNVHRNNGIAYDRTIKVPELQKRYWYFKEVKGIQGYGQDDKILVQPGVTFAGDVYNLGLGKLIAMRYVLGGKPVLRLGVLADTGGAFVPNLYQLDYLSGIYPDRPSFQKGVANLPEFAETFVLIAK